MSGAPVCSLLPMNPLAASITVRVDRIYGKITIYPVCERAQLLAQIAGTKTLTNTVLAYAERMGFQIVNVGLVVA